MKIVVKNSNEGGATKVLARKTSRRFALIQNRSGYDIAIGFSPSVTIDSSTATDGVVLENGESISLPELTANGMLSEIQVYAIHGEVDGTDPELTVIDY